jgi:hypothetical protein
VGKYLVLGVAAITAISCARRPKRPKGAADSDENQAILHKIQNYITCLEAAPHVFELEDAYVTRFGTTPPTEKIEYPLHASPDSGQCWEMVVKSAQLAPHDAALEHAANAYLGALVTLEALTTAERDAFDPVSKAYAPARGIALHPQVLAALKAFDPIANDLYDRVFELNRKAHEDQYRRRLAVDGHTFEMKNEDLMLRAEDIVRRAAVPSDRLDALPIDDLGPRVAALDMVAQEILAYADDKPKEADELMKPYWPMANATHAFVLAAKQVVARATDHIAYSDLEKLMISAGNEKDVAGTPAALVAAYNKLVAQYRPLATWPR